MNIWIGSSPMENSSRSFLNEKLGGSKKAEVAIETINKPRM